MEESSIFEISTLKDDDEGEAYVSLTRTEASATEILQKLDSILKKNVTPFAWALQETYLSYNKHLPKEMDLFLENLESGNNFSSDFVYYCNTFFDCKSSAPSELVTNILEKLPDKYLYFFDRMEGLADVLLTPENYKPFMCSILSYKLLHDISARSLLRLVPDDRFVEIFIRNTGTRISNSVGNSSSGVSSSSSGELAQATLAQAMVDAFPPKYFFLIRQEMKVAVDYTHVSIYYQSSFCRKVYDYAKQKFYNKATGFAKRLTLDDKIKLIEYLIRYFNLAMPHLTMPHLTMPHLTMPHLANVLNKDSYTTDVYTIFTGLYGKKIFSALPNDVSDVIFIKFFLPSNWCAELFQKLHNRSSQDELWKAYFEPPNNLFQNLVDSENKNIKGFMKQVWDLLRSEIVTEGKITDRFLRTGISFNVFELPPRGTRVPAELRKEVEIRALSCLFMEFDSMFLDILEKNAETFAYKPFLQLFFKMYCLDLVSDSEKQIVLKNDMYKYGKDDGLLESIRYFFLDEDMPIAWTSRFALLESVPKIKALLASINLNPFHDKPMLRISYGLFMLGKTNHGADREIDIDEKSARILLDALASSSATRAEILRVFPFLSKAVNAIFKRYKSLVDSSALRARTLYHGTSAFYLPHILKNGLDGKYPNDFVRENLDAMMYYFFVFAYATIGNEKKYWPDTGINKVFPNLNLSTLEVCNEFFLRYITLFYDRQRENKEEKFFTSKLLNAYSFSFGEIGEGPFHLLKLPVFFEKEMVLFWSEKSEKNGRYIRAICDEYSIPVPKSVSLPLLERLIEESKKLFARASGYPGVILAIDLEDPVIDELTQKSLSHEKNEGLYPRLDGYEFVYGKGSNIPPEKIFLCVDCGKLAEEEIDKLRIKFASSSSSSSGYLNMDDKNLLWFAKNYDMTDLVKQKLLPIQSIDAAVLEPLPPKEYNSYFQSLLTVSYSSSSFSSPFKKQKRPRKNFDEELEFNVKLLTYNVDWKAVEGKCAERDEDFKCIQNVGRVVQKGDYDIVSLQEINLENKLHYDVFEEFIAPTDDFNVYASTSEKSGNVTMVKKSSIFGESKPFSVLRSEFSPGRPFLIVIFEDPKVVHINCHYLHEYEMAGENLLERWKNHGALFSQKIREKLRPYKDKLFLERYDYIVSGDFNKQFKNSQEMNGFFKDLLADDDRLSFTWWPYSYNTCCRGDEFSYMYDYIFTTFKDIVSYGIPETPLKSSDHLPIETMVTVRKRL